MIHRAYQVLSDPERRAQYDVGHQQADRNRWRIDPSDAEAENDFDLEQMVRLTLLEVLYTRLRGSDDPGLFVLDFEELLGRPREHLEFTTWYLVQKGLLKQTENSKLAITADGVEFLRGITAGRCGGGWAEKSNSASIRSQRRAYLRAFVDVHMAVACCREAREVVFQDGDVDVFLRPAQATQICGG